MTIDNIKNKIETFTDEEFKSLKTQFDLINSYAEKLKFWEVHFPYSHTKYFGYCNKVLESGWDIETISDADQISVFPMLKKGDQLSDNYKLFIEERKQYFEWIEPKLIEYSFSLRKETFLEDLAGSVNKNEFLDWFSSNLNDEIDVLLGRKNRVLHASFYHSKQKGYEGLVRNKKIDYTDNSIFDDLDEIQNFIYGRNLALFKNFIDNFELNQYLSKPKKSNVYTNVEKILILTFYQSVADFPKFDPKKGQTKKEFQNVIAVLTGDDASVIKDAFSKVQKILDKKDITKGSAPTKLKSLEIVKQYFISTKNSFLEEKVQILMDEISRKSGYYKN
ncbi:MAG: hypothetical protein JNL49_05930 [Bacteroidia bacterium]|nr:hypothetical protein [Bacteroidia bacterium]